MQGCNLITLPCDGPSNQVISIKETVVLASLLGCNVIMHGVLNHISEANITRPDIQCGLGVKRQRFKSKSKRRRKRLKRAGRVQGNDGSNADIGGLNHGGDNVIAGARRSLSHVSPRWQDDDTSSDTMHTDDGFYQGVLDGDLAPAAGSDPHGQLRSLQQAAGADGSGSDVHDVLMPYDLLLDR